MDTVTGPRPEGRIGYATSDLQDFLRAADLRCEWLRQQVAAAHARRDVALSRQRSAADRRREIAETWMAAHAEAEAQRPGLDRGDDDYSAEDR